MKYAIGFVFVMSCVNGGSEQQKPISPPATKAVIPSTAAGQVLTAWLDAFNSGDEARLKTFTETYKATSFAVDMKFRKQTGGFDLLSVDKSDPHRIEFVVKEKASETTAVGVLKVTDNTIASFDLKAIAPKTPINAVTRARVIDGIARTLNELYVFPDVAKKMEEALREHDKNGAYEDVTDAGAFAKLLTQQLQAVSHDKHLHVRFSAALLPEDQPEPNKVGMREKLESMNCGFEKAEKLDGNIGYMKFNFFGDADICGPKASAAFAAIGDVDAMIFDLRENGGGEPAMVAYVSSYLFDKRTHLNDIYNRAEDKTEEYWTKPDVPGTKLAKQPVYVLTSSKTFSGAEEFSYNLKNLKRATIIGETTGGGAHPTKGVRVDDHFMIGVPAARAINPITKTNWEGTGVQPDIKVPAPDALETAKQLAAKPSKRK